MTSHYLQAEQERLLAQIDSIRNSGAIAPAGVRIEPDFLNPKCWILSYTHLPMRERRLGTSNSAHYKDWAARIQRRNALEELEKQLALLQALIERQANSEVVAVEQSPQLDAGDLVEFAGHHYYVEDVGFRYLRLSSPDGKVTRCAIAEAKLVSRAGELCDLPLTHA